MISETVPPRRSAAYYLLSVLAVACLVITTLVLVDTLLSPLDAQAYSGSVTTRLLYGLLLAPLTAVIGVLCVRYSQGNIVGILLIFMGAGAALLSVRTAYGPLVVVYGGYTGVALFWASYLLLFLYFPNGRPHFRRAGTAMGGVALLLFTFAFAGQILTSPVLTFGAQGSATSVLNPFYRPGLEGIYSLFSSVAAVMISIYLLFVLVSFILRYRAAERHEQKQIKWFLWGFSIWLAPQIVVAVLPGLPPALTEGVAAYGQNAAAFVAPLAIGAAILLNKLWDIDIIIRRTLVYSVLTAMLALVYWGGVLLLQSLLRPLTGEGNDLAVVATTLAVVVLFMPLRRIVQGFIDRRFYRRKYDAAKTLSAFSQTARDEVDLDRLAGRLAEVVDETMQPAYVSVWLASTQRKA